MDTKALPRATTPGENIATHTATQTATTSGIRDTQTFLGVMGIEARLLQLTDEYSARNGSPTKVEEPFLCLFMLKGREMASQC